MRLIEGISSGIECGIPTSYIAYMLHHPPFIVVIIIEYLVFLGYVLYE